MTAKRAPAPTVAALTLTHRDALSFLDGCIAALSTSAAAAWCASRASKDAILFHGRLSHRATRFSAVRALRGPWLVGSWLPPFDNPVLTSG